MESAGRTGFLKLALSLLLFSQLTDAEYSQSCPVGGSWVTAFCDVEWEGVNLETRSTECWEPEAGNGNNLECVPDLGDLPDQGLFDIHRCKRRGCSSHDDCRTFCGADMKCEASSNDLARSGACQDNSDCVGGRVCCYDDCFLMGICKVLNACKKGALCEVTYSDDSVETRACPANTDFECVDDPDVAAASILDAVAIKRCDNKRCTIDDDCYGTCEGPGKCDPYPDNRNRGQLGIFYAGECASSADCIGGYACCPDDDFQWQDDPIPWMCQPSDRCPASQDNSDSEED